MRQYFLDLSTNNETSFFRDQRVFNAVNSLFRQMIQNKEVQGEIRIWSAACSYGQEPISLSILLHELIKELNTQVTYRIRATDISTLALSKARNARYTGFEVSRGLSEEHRKKYFLSEVNDSWKVHKEIVDPINYEALNLIGEFPLTDKYHFIFCRNVLIYQNLESKIDILNRMTEQLLPGGYLILGSGESLLGLSESYRQLMIEGAVVYKKNE